MDDHEHIEQIMRWPPHIVMSPTSLKSYGQCAYRIQLQYLLNAKPPDTWVQFFALGNATHSALGTIAQQLKVGVEPIGENEIRTLCGFHIPIHEYPSPEAREADILSVLEWVRRGRHWLERQTIDEWLVIEQSQRREIPLLPTRSRYKLLAKPDLVVRRTDEDGVPFIHIIDWKTGGIRPEDDVPVITRYVLRERLQEWLGNATTANVRFTWQWLRENDHTDVDVSVEHCTSAWQGIVDQMERLATETAWQATPGWHCRYCPFYENHCPEKMPIDLD